MTTELRGIVIEESLGDPAVLAPLQIVRTETVDIADPVAGQPPRWNLLHFRAPAAQAESLARSFQEALVPGPWYVDFVVGDEHVVVFGDEVFRYQRDDRSARDLARDHGRHLGVPEVQLDWED